MKTTINKTKRYFKELKSGERFNFHGSLHLRLDNGLQAAELDTGILKNFQEGHEVHPENPKEGFIAFGKVSVGQAFLYKEKLWLKVCTNAAGNVFLAMRIGGGQGDIGEDLSYGTPVQLVKEIEATI